MTETDIVMQSFLFIFKLLRLFVKGHSFEKFLPADLVACPCEIGFLVLIAILDLKSLNILYNFDL